MWSKFDVSEYPVKKQTRIILVFFGDNDPELEMILLGSLDHFFNSIYEELPGWKSDLGSAQRFRNLPKPARDYIRRVEELTETEVALISVGQRRQDTIVRRNPFQKGRRLSKMFGGREWKAHRNFCRS